MISEQGSIEYMTTGKSDMLPQPAGKLHSIQLLRAIAALLVVLFHGHLAFANRLDSSALDYESYVFAFGAVGVHIFFVISGFIMVYTSRFGGDAETGFDAPAFFRRRVLRIYPIYWICIALYALSYWLIGDPYEVSASETIGALLLLPGDAAVLIGPAWTLAFEMYFYLCFGLAMMAGRERGLLLLAGVFIAMIAAGMFVRIDNSLWALATNPLLTEFLAGAAIAWLCVTGRLPRRGGPTLIVLACLIFVVGIIVGYDRLPLFISWGAPSILLIAGLVMAERAHGAQETVRKLGHFGDSSYALYLIHIIVIAMALWLTDLIAPRADIVPIIAAIPISLVAIALGEFLHHKVELPMLRKLNPKRSLVPVKQPQV